MRSTKNTLSLLLAVTLLVAIMLQAGCYTHREDEDTDEDDASVSINFGGHGALSALSGYESVPDIQPKAIPEPVTHIDLRVSGPDMEDFAQRYEVPSSGEDLIVELTFPVGTDRLFESDALRIEAGDDEIILYQGQALEDLVTGPNTVTISMEGRASIVGRISYIDTDWPHSVTDPLENHSETTGPLPLETDANGVYRIDLLPLNVAHRVEVYPEECPADEMWVGCQTFGEITLTEAGEEGVLDLFIIPPAGAFEWRSWASSVVPNEGGPNDIVTVFGVDFSEGMTGEQPNLMFEIIDGFIYSENMTDWSSTFITAEVPGNSQIQAVAGYSPGSSEMVESNFLPFTYTGTD